MTKNESAKTQEMVRTFLQNCNFDVVDSEVHFDLNGDGKPDFSLDVVAIFDKYLISIECESAKLTQPRRDIAAVKSTLETMITKKDFKILQSDLKKITHAKLSKIKEFRHCYAFGKNFTEHPDLKAILSKEHMLLWDYEILQYYHKTSKILGHFTRNEILHDFGIKIGAGSYTEDAIEVNQGDHTMYLLGMHPGLLLNMAYVFRRTKKEAAAYQRIINKERLENLSNFLKTKDLLLANPVIIAFDKDMKDEIQYNKTKKELSFPTSYCSAWVIDGQHRIFAFKDTSYRNWSEEKNNEFKLPVVVFKDISETQQNRTFVNINYYQKRIDPILFCDLAASVKDLRYELTWSSLLVKYLNDNDGPWKGMIKTSEIHGNRPISIAAFARHTLLLDLLGYDEQSRKYLGPLHKYAPFYTNLPFSNDKNKRAFDKQVKLLNWFFSVIKKHTQNKNVNKDKWNNSRKYGLTKATSVNALLLVLKSMMDEVPKMNVNLEDYLLPIKKMNFNNKHLLKYGRGFAAYRPLANELIKQINIHKKTNFKTV